MSTESPQHETGLLLVVDDNEMNRDMLSRRLTRRGHDVKVAEDGYIALEMLEKDAFDVVLLDVTMPGIDGYETLKRIRETKSPTDLPVIMATAKGETEDIVNAFELGANDYVTKPLNFPVVQARVQTQLSVKRSVDKIIQLERNLVARNSQLEVANKRMHNDLMAAARVQQAGFPTIPPTVDGVEFAWAYHPCDELGGDSLNVFQLDDQHVGLYVLDVSGHGVPAALLSVTLNRDLTPRKDNSCLVTEVGPLPPAVMATNPISLAEKLNRIYPMNFETRQYFTVLYGLLDVKARTFRFVGAGHPGPVHVGASHQGVREVTGFPIGVVDEADYDDDLIQLEVGDRLFLYSDGIIEERNADGVMFTKERLVEAVHKARKLPLEASVQSIIEEVKTWCEPGRTTDDLTVLAFEIGEQKEPEYQI